MSSRSNTLTFCATWGPFPNVVWCYRGCNTKDHRSAKPREDVNTSNGRVGEDWPGLLRPHQREEDRLPDAQAGERHEQAIDSDAHSPGRGHAVLHRAQEVLVELHRLGVPL